MQARCLFKIQPDAFFEGRGGRSAALFVLLSLRVRLIWARSSQYFGWWMKVKCLAVDVQWIIVLLLLVFKNWVSHSIPIYLDLFHFCQHLPLLRTEGLYNSTNHLLEFKNIPKKTQPVVHGKVLKFWDVFPLRCLLSGETPSCASCCSYPANCGANWSMVRLRFLGLTTEPQRRAGYGGFVMLWKWVKTPLLTKQRPLQSSSFSLLKTAAVLVIRQIACQAEQQNHGLVWAQSQRTWAEFLSFFEAIRTPTTATTSVTIKIKQ